MGKLRLSRRRLASTVGAMSASALVVTACTGGHDLVDQTAPGRYTFDGATKAGQVWPQSKRKPAGDATAAYLDGSKKFRLTSLAGQVVVLNYWATYCGPCVTESSAYDKLYRAHKADGVEFVGIDVKESSRSKAAAFVADNNISYPILWDQTAHTALQLGKVPASLLPSTVVIDRRGRVAAVYIGAQQSGDLGPVLDELAKET